MSPSKPYRSRLKPSPSTRGLPPQTRKQLQEMPVEEFNMEIVTLRLTASRALDLFDMSTCEEERIRAINTGVASLKAVVKAIFKNQSLYAEAPAVQELWEAIKTADETDGIDEMV